MANNKGKSGKKSSPQSFTHATQSGGGYTGIGPGGGGYTGWEPSPPPVIEPPRVVITPTIPEPSPPPDVGPPQYTPASGPGTQVSRGGTIYEFRGGAWNPVGSGGGTSPGSPREVIVSEPTTPEPVLETITPAEDLTRKPYKEEGAPGTTILATERYFSMLAQREAARTAPKPPTTMPEHPVTRTIGMTTFVLTPEEYTEKIAIGGRTFVFKDEPPKGMVFDIEAAKGEAVKGKGIIVKDTQEKLAIQFPTKVEYKYTPEQIEFAKGKARGELALEMVEKAKPGELRALGWRTLLSPKGAEFLAASLMREPRKPIIAKQLEEDILAAEKGEKFFGEGFKVEKVPYKPGITEDIASKYLKGLPTVSKKPPKEVEQLTGEFGSFGRGVVGGLESPVVEAQMEFIPGFGLGKLLKIPKIAKFAMTKGGKSLLYGTTAVTAVPAVGQIALAPTPQKQAEAVVSIGAGLAGFGAGFAAGRAGAKTYEVTKITGITRGKTVTGKGVGKTVPDTEVTFGAKLEPTQKGPIEQFSVKELMGGPKTVTKVSYYAQAPSGAAYLRRMETFEPQLIKYFTKTPPKGKIPESFEFQEAGTLTRATSGKLANAFAMSKRMDTYLFPYKRPTPIRYSFVPKKKGKPRDVLKELGDQIRKEQQAKALERAAMTRGRLLTKFKEPAGTTKTPKPTQASKQMGEVISVQELSAPRLMGGMGLISGQMTKQEQETRLKQMRGMEKASKSELLGRGGMSLGLGLKPTLDDDVEQIIGQKPSQRQRQRQLLRPGTRTGLTPEYPEPPPIKIKKPDPPWIPKLDFPDALDSLLKKRKPGKRVKALQGTRYTPSLSGLYVGGKQKKPKRLTGIEIRRVLH